MTISTIRRCMLFSVLGMLLLVVNLYIPTGLHYTHSYENDSSIIGEYQYYNIKSFYGATCTYKVLDASGKVIKDSIPQGYETEAVFVDQVFFGHLRIDLFNDFIGLILIILSCSFFSKYHKSFGLAILFASMSIVIKSVLCALPFVFNGVVLCNLSLGIGMSYLFAVIVTTFFMLTGYTILIPDASCRDERLWINTAWFISFVLMVLTFFLRWLDLSALCTVFTIGLILVITLIGYFLKRVDIFVFKFCQDSEEVTQATTKK